MMKQADIERINAVKDAAFAVPDGSTLTFVLHDGRRVEVDFQTLAEWFCLEFNVEIDWDAG